MDSNRWSAERMSDDKTKAVGLRYYIATSLERAADCRALSKFLDAFGWECTYDWTAHGSVQGQGLDIIETVATYEVAGVLVANVLIALLPGGRGTHCEIGMAIAVGKPVILVCDADELKDASGRECSFYYAPCVTRISAKSHVAIALCALLAVERSRGKETVNITAKKVDELWRSVR